MAYSDIIFYAEELNDLKSLGFYQQVFEGVGAEQKVRVKQNGVRSR